MPFGRWLFFVVMLAISCAVAMFPLIFFIAEDPRFFRRGPNYYGGGMYGGMFVVMLSLLEPIVDYGLIRRRFWAWIVGLGYFGPKAIGSAGMTIGQAMGGQEGTMYAWIGGGLAVLWGGIAVFLLLNKSWFDS